jgi:hypothetical protein
METVPQLNLREQIRLALVETLPEASPDRVETALDKIMVAVDPFEKELARVVDQYRNTIVGLAR